MDLLLFEIKNVFLPETVLLGFILFNIIFSLFFGKRFYKISERIALCGVLIPMASMALGVSNPGYTIFSEEFIQTNFTIVLKILILTGTLFTVLLSQNLTKKLRFRAFEFYTILLVSAFSALCLVSANDFLPFFVMLEMLVVSNALLIGYWDKNHAKEAAFKYLINSGVASAVLLFGVSYLYGISGELNFSMLYSSYYSQDSSVLYALAGIFIIAGLAFQTCCVPFQRWLPDVNQGASYPVAAYVSAVPVIAAFGIMSRIIANVFTDAPFLQFVMSLMAIITILYGFCGAARQTNIKRFASYSAAAQCGFMMLAVSVFSSYGSAAFIYYAITYLFMSFGAWAAAITFVNSTKSDEIKDYTGIFFVRPYYTAAFSICLFALAGFPPLAGFLSKLCLFTAVMRADSSGLPILIFAVLTTVLGVFVYMNFLKNFFIKNKNANCIIEEQMNTKIVLYFCSLMLIFTFFFANQIIWVAMFASLGI